MNLTLTNLANYLNLVISAPGETGGDTISAKVSKIIDGDTLEVILNGKKTSLRLLGINTPEKGESGYEKAAKTLENLLTNKNILLKIKGKDGYERPLAVVYNLNKEDLNASMIASGWAHVMLVEPGKLSQATVKHYLTLQENAKAAGIGIWNPNLSRRYQGELHITSFHANAKGNDEQNPQAEYLRIANLSHKTLNLAEYKIKNYATGKVYALPAAKLPAGWSITIHSGKGNNQTNPVAGPLKIYLQTQTPIWNNQGAMVIILDQNSRIIDCKRSKKNFKVPESYNRWSFYGE